MQTSLPRVSGPYATQSQMTALEISGHPTCQAEDNDLVDWDSQILNPPVRGRRKVRVRFRQGGRREPKLFDDLRD